jgi:hypothetical protein
MASRDQLDGGIAQTFDDIQVLLWNSENAVDALVFQRSDK